MITVQRAAQRHQEHRRKYDVWHSFDRGAVHNLSRRSFGVLEDLDESRMPPGAAASQRWHRDAEVITYVREGSVVYDGPVGNGIIHAGEFQRRTTRRGDRHRERNTSRHDAAHIFHVWLGIGGAANESRSEQKRFGTAERRGVLCVVASVDGRQGSLGIHQDVLLHSAVLDPGQHVVLELGEDHGAWVHLIEGEVKLSDVILHTGDGAGITAERAVSITAREVTELMLLDLKRASLKDTSWT